LNINDKSLSFWTKRGTNWKLIYKEEFETKTEAFKREKWLKTGIGREYLKRILKDK
jgi:putative endonuclease